LLGACEKDSPSFSPGSKVCGVLFVKIISERRNAHGRHYHRTFVASKHLCGMMLRDYSK
jgi:hypothetical protein